MTAQLHGVLVCAGITGGALAIVAVGCAVVYVCGALVDRHIEQALGPARFSPATEVAVAEALLLANDDRPALAEHAPGYGAVPVPDQLAARRHARTGTQ